jgi:hypothetical protein
MVRVIACLAASFCLQNIAFAAGQTIFFSPIPNQIFGGKSFVIAARASSGLPVTLTSTTPAVCRVSGVSVTLLSPGPCFIAASQSGNGIYNSATPVSRGFTVIPARPSGTLRAARSPLTLDVMASVMAVGDFNGDGVADLVAASDDSGTLTVLLGNGTGGFAPAPGKPIVAGIGPHSLVVGDFNADGNPDIAVANAGSNSISVFLGDGLGGFAAAPGSPIALRASPRALVIGDFNADGIQDLVTANSTDNSITVLAGDGLGAFSAMAGSPFHIGVAPDSLVDADFNGDGLPDLAVASAKQGTITVLLSNAAGGFTEVTTLSAESGFCSLVTGDFNGDGIPDLALASIATDDITVELGNGLGSFNPAAGSPFLVGAVSSSIIAADFNGDGFQDLAVATTDADSIVVLPGNGRGGFSTPGSFAVGEGTNPVFLATADFNGDGIPDVATANIGSGDIAILLGGLVSALPVLSTTSPPTIALGQPVPLTVTLGRDTNSFTSPEGTVEVSDGTTTLGSATLTTGPRTFLATGLTVGRHTLSATYSGDARNAGSVSEAITIQVVAPQSASPMDSGTVARMPTASTSPVNQTISFDAIPKQILGISPFPITARTSSAMPVGFASTTPQVCKTAGALVSLLSAGTCSITASGSSATPVTRSFNVSTAKASGTFAAATGGPLSIASAQSVAVGDFNGDGIQDLATTNYLSGTVTVQLGNGSGRFSSTGSPIATGQYPRSVVVGDFNGDGIQDLAIANSGDNTVTVLSGNGSGGFTATAGSPFAVGNYPYAIVEGDFNGDGIPDLATANYSGNNVTVLLGNAAGGFSAAAGSPFAVGSGPFSLALADFNGDGIPDIAVANIAGNNVAVLLGNGSGGFAAAPGSPFAAGSEPGSVIAGDFNGDGFADLAIANTTGNNVSVLLGNGAGGFTGAPGSPFAVGTEPVLIVAADFNGDGIQDLASANIAGNNVSVLLGNGTGGFMPSNGGPFATGTGPFALAVGDFNGDGAVDLAIPNFGSNNVQVLLGARIRRTRIGRVVAVGRVGSAGAADADDFEPLTPLTPPTGTATFNDGTTVPGTLTQTASPHSFTASAPSPGIH